MARRRMNFSALPLKPFSSIIGFLDDKSACQLRKVSRSTRDKVDAVMLNTRETVVDVSCFLDEIKDEVIVICFTLKNLREYELWLNCLFLAARSLPFNDDKFYLRKKQFMVNINLSVDETKGLLQFLKERTVDTYFNLVRFLVGGANDLCREWVDFFAGKPCAELALICSVGDTENDRNILSELAMQLDADTIGLFCPNFTKDYVLFAIEMANYAEILELTVAHSDGVLPNILSFLRQILSGGLCHTFIFNEHTAENASIRADDVEKLVQLVHGMEKKMCIDISTSAPPMENTIGEYNVRIFPVQDEHNRVVIEPIED